MFVDAGFTFSPQGFERTEAEARAEVARKVTSGQTGTERYLWRPYFEAVLRGSFPANPADEELGTVGDLLRAEHEAQHLWSWSPPQIVDALDALKARGVRLGVITNADGRMESAIRAAGIRARFEFVIDSADVGVSKPDPTIFQMAADALGLEPARCVYVGDLFHVDVLGARGAGMGAVLVDPVGQFGEFPVPRVASVRDLPTLLAAPVSGGTDDMVPFDEGLR